MSNKYRVGDRIRDIDTGWIGTVIGDKYGGKWNYLVAYDENGEIKGDNEYYVREEDVEFVDKKQAFLERLQELLRDFDAEINIHGYGYLYAKSGNECIFFGHERLTSDNIINDDKE